MSKEFKKYVYKVKTSRSRHRGAGGAGGAIAPPLFAKA